MPKCDGFHKKLDFFLNFTNVVNVKYILAHLPSCRRSSEDVPEGASSRHLFLQYLRLYFSLFRIVSKQKVVISKKCVFLFSRTTR